MRPWWLSPCYKQNCSANFRWRKYPRRLELLSYCHLKVPLVTRGASQDVMLQGIAAFLLSVLSGYVYCYCRRGSTFRWCPAAHGLSSVAAGWVLQLSQQVELQQGCMAVLLPLASHVSVLGETGFTWSLLFSQLPSGSLLCPTVVLEAKMGNGFYWLTFVPCWMLRSAAVTRGDVCICSVKDMLHAVNKGRKCVCTASAHL